MLLISLAIIAMADTPSKALSAEPAQTPRDLFASLAGSCYQADMPDKATDTHCFTLSESGMLALDVHKVRTADGAVVYEGVTAYHPEMGSGDAIGKQAAAGKVDNAGSGAVTFGYYNSLGGLMEGAAVRNGDEIDFNIRMPDGPASATWKLTADGYDVVVAGGTSHFRKIGPVPEGGL